MAAAAGCGAQSSSFGGRSANSDSEWGGWHFSGGDGRIDWGTIKFPSATSSCDKRPDQLFDVAAVGLGLPPLLPEMCPNCVCRLQSMGLIPPRPVASTR